MNDWTPIPGTILKNDEAIKIIRKFRAKYRVNVNEQPDNIPTWCTFPPGIKIDESILRHPRIEIEISLYFYVENRNEIYTAKPEQIQHYFSHRNPWEDNWDFYVFNASLAWCIAITHGLADGSAFILVTNGANCLQSFMGRKRQNLSFEQIISQSQPYAMLNWAEMCNYQQSKL